MRTPAAERPFAELLREYRRAAGLSQEALAERAGLSVRAIAALEQGARRAPYRETVVGLAHALDLPGAAEREFEAAAARGRTRRRPTAGPLPASLTSFVERGDEDALQKKVGEHRLVTLTGTGGIGKTRTAIELARRLGHRFQETVFVDLLPLHSGGLVAPVIAARLNIEVQGEDTVAAIVADLRQRTTLLVLDNCEHVIGDAADTVARLLRECPALTVLTTSREVLGIQGEAVYRLPPMDANTASALFVDRAEVADRAWVWNPEKLAAVAAICAELDGIPLAIELAASRVWTLGLDALRRRIRAAVTEISGRDIALRHQTMAATIAWSYDLLSDAERALFRRLSVFVGSFGLEAAEVVCANGDFAARDIAEDLGRLVQKSLVIVDHVDTSTRYRLLDVMRTFAMQRLVESKEVDATMRRLVERLESCAASFDGLAPAALAGERAELGNVRAAVTWACSREDQADVVVAARTVIGFRLVWMGPARRELVALVLALLDRLDDRESPREVGRLINAIVGDVGDEELAQLALRGLPLLAQEADRGRAADIHARVALVEHSRGDVASARAHLACVEELLNTREERNARAGLIALASAAYVYTRLGDFAMARASCDDLEIRSLEHELDFMVIRAEIEFRDGNIEQAIALLRTSSAKIDREQVDHRIAIRMFGSLARYELAIGKTDAAQTHLCEAIRAAVESRDSGFRYAANDLAATAAALAKHSDRGDLSKRLAHAAQAPGDEVYDLLDRFLEDDPDTDTA